MRLIILLLLSAAQVAWCQSSTVTEKDFGKLSWLEGTWVRTNSKPGRSASERWTKGKDNELIGLAVTLKGSDTAFVEKLKLVAKSGSVYYVADVPENQKPIDFLITTLDNNGFVCENPSHDFPKKISYRRDGDKIRAVISGDGKEIEYLFERRKQ